MLAVAERRCTMFEQAKWIWNRQTIGTDCYCEFVSTASLDGAKATKLRISADSNYALYINGRFIDSGQYADYPFYKVYDELDITKHIVSGENHIAVIVWYYGASFFTYSVGKPGLLFELEQDGKVVLWSDSDVLSRKSKRYISGKNEAITAQLGFNFHVDLTHGDTWMAGRRNDGFEKSTVCGDMPRELLPRPVKKLEIGAVKRGVLVSQGGFSYTDEAGDFAAKMQHAALSFYRAEEMTDAAPGVLALTGKAGEGIFFIVDLGEESTGYLDFDLEVPEDCRMEVGWGEHLADGRCRTKIGRRNFSVTLRLKAGENHYMNPFRRFGCRYLQFFIHTNKVKIHHAGIRPTVYPLTVKKYRSGNLLRDMIYAVCQNTLIQCMHEHYEDCPWREQSFYTLDSRNQMLCGYYAFGEYDFAKASLRLLSKSVQSDGLLTICCPTDEKLKIISFSLFYILQLTEYYRYTQDAETVQYCFQTAKTIMDTFVGRIDASGLIANFAGEQYWNFYEWQPRLDGADKTPGRYDTCLNALLAMALEHFAELCKAVHHEARDYAACRERLIRAMHDELFDLKMGLFRLYRGQTDACVSVLANALGYLSGAVGREEADALLALVAKSTCREPTCEVIPATLSMDTFRYEALLKADREKYADHILDEIDRTYLRMLQSGATSFWETAKGECDFHNAGSLCHGWSAMPIYYYETLFSKGSRYL